MPDTAYQGFIRERLKDVPFPCHLLAYGQERDQRTTYRREHCGCFGVAQIENLDEAVKFVYGLQYEGCVSEMRFLWSDSQFNEA